MSGGIRELVLAVPQAPHLAVTLTLPARSPRGPVLLTMNAGVLGRPGPQRINVKLARAVAQRGGASVRVDLSGLGDSRRATQPADDYLLQTRHDLQAVMAAVQGLTGLDRFVVFGICSGAQNALELAAHDDRVEALWLVDGPAWPTSTTKWWRILLNLRRRPGVTLAGWWRRWRSPKVPAVAPTANALPTGQADGPQRWAARMDELCARGVRVTLWFTSSWLAYVSHPRQLHRQFSGHAFLSASRIEFLPELDHTLTTLDGQHRLLEDVGTWLDERAQRG